MNDQLPEAIGYLRQAAHDLLRNPDPTGHALILAIRVLDLADVLGELDVEPALVPASASAVQSLTAAAELLGQVANRMPAEVWPALNNVLAQVDVHGHR